MAVKALSMNKEINYVSENDDAKGTDGETVFILRAISARTVALIRDKSTRFVNVGEGKEPEIEMNLNTANLEMVRYGLKGFRNFYSNEGEVAFLTEKDAFGEVVVKEETLNAIPADLIQELARAIQGFNSIDEQTRKN